MDLKISPSDNSGSKTQLAQGITELQKLIPPNGVTILKVTSSQPIPTDNAPIKSLFEIVLSKNGQDYKVTSNRSFTPNDIVKIQINDIGVLKVLNIKPQPTAIAPQIIIQNALREALTLQQSPTLILNNLIKLITANSASTPQLQHLYKQVAQLIRQQPNQHQLANPKTIKQAFASSGNLLEAKFASIIKNIQSVHPQLKTTGQLIQVIRQQPQLQVQLQTLKNTDLKSQLLRLVTDLTPHIAKQAATSDQIPKTISNTLKQETINAPEPKLIALIKNIQINNPQLKTAEQLMQFISLQPQLKAQLQALNNTGLNTPLHTQQHIQQSQSQSHLLNLIKSIIEPQATQQTLISQKSTQAAITQTIKQTTNNKPHQPTNNESKKTTIYKNLSLTNKNIGLKISTSPIAEKTTTTNESNILSKIIAASNAVKTSGAKTQTSTEPPITSPLLLPNLPINTDIKTLLITSTGKTNQPTATKDSLDLSIGIMLRQVAAGIAKIQAQQLSSLSGRAAGAEGTTNQIMNMEIPVYTEGQFRPIQIQIEEENTADTTTEKLQKGRKWKITLGFDLEKLGKFYATISIVQASISTIFWSETPETLQKIKHELNYLKQSLINKGLNVEQLECKHGTPPLKKTRLDQQLLDIKT